MSAAESYRDDREVPHRSALDATFSVFFADHRLDVERLLYAREGDRGLVEEVVTDSFHAAYQRWDAVRHYEKPVAWVIRVARNRLGTCQRNRMRRPLELVPDVTVDEAATPSSEAREAEEILFGLLRRMGPRLAEVACLAWYEWTDREIAQTLGLTYNTVRSYRQQARQEMQRLLGEDER